jgi:glutamine amidotransferase
MALALAPVIRQSERRMARLIGFIANRPDVGDKTIALEGKALVARPPNGDAEANPLGWGVGFYQAGEVLLKRRPIDDAREVRIADVVRDVRTDLLIGHVRSGTVGSPRTENTHPFRYRQWLFAQTGTIDAFDKIRGRMLDSLPQFLQRNVRGETDSEVLFHLVLSFLHDAGELDRAHVDPAAARGALRSSLTLVDRLSAEEGAGPNRVNALLSNSEYLLALAAGEPAAYRIYRGSDFERILGDGELGRMRVPDYASSQLSLFASDFEGGTPRGWTALQGRSIVTFERGAEPVIEPL